MNTFRPPWPGQRPGRLYTLALVLLGLLAAVALLQTDRGARQIERAGQTRLDAARLVHGLGRLVDDARGLEALHLLQDDPADRRATEQRLIAQRGALLERLQLRAAATDTEERRCRDAVTARLGTWWAVQDRLLEASRLAHRDRRDAALAASARGLLNGDSQQAWRGVVDALERWWRVQDDGALAAASPAGIGQRLMLPIGLAALLVLVMLALLRAEGLATPEPRGPGPVGERRGVPRAGGADTDRRGGHATPASGTAIEQRATPQRQQVVDASVRRARVLYLVGAPAAAPSAGAVAVDGGGTVIACRDADAAAEPSGAAMPVTGQAVPL